jgi:alpha-glucosidase
MGAFISTYGGVKYPNLFSKIGIFSPAFWFSLTNMSSYITSSTNDLTDLRMYFVAGQNESSTMVNNSNTIKNNFLTEGVAASNILTKYDSYGTHTESYWRGEFSAAYLWLFQNEILTNTNFEGQEIIVFQNNRGEIAVDGLSEESNFLVYSIIGQQVGELQLNNGTNAIPFDFQSGLYLLKSASNPSQKPIKIYIQH